jgi:hypothetical protein
MRFLTAGFFIRQLTLILRRRQWHSYTIPRTAVSIKLLYCTYSQRLHCQSCKNYVIAVLNISRVCGANDINDTTVGRIAVTMKPLYQET